MREITLQRGNRKTSVPKWLIRKAVKEVYGDSLSISARRKRIAAAKRKRARKAAAKKVK